MTVDTTGGGGAAVVPYSGDYGDVGLEDIGASDVVIPRLSIRHKDATFRDNLSNAEYPKLTVILLGLVKQRIFWKRETDDGDKPLCKSPDHDNGFPNVSDEVPADKRFPWAKSNFNQADFPPEQGINGLVTLPCSSCVFQQWDKGDWKVPPCAEQHTYPLLYNHDPEDPTAWTPALLSFSKTGIKPSRTYISSFAQAKVPMFTVMTELTLTQQSRGSVEYCTPNFKRLGGTDRSEWGEYADQYRSIRDFIRSAPRRQDEDDEAGITVSSNVNTPPTPAPASAAAPAAAPASSPGSAPAAAPTAPAAPAPAQQSAAAPAQPASAPAPAPAVATPAPSESTAAASPSPSAPPAAEPTAPAAPAPAAPATDDPDGLPF